MLIREGRKTITRALSCGLTRSQLFMTWSEDIGRGSAASPDAVKGLLKYLASSYFELLPESIEVAITFYNASERAKVLPANIAKQIVHDFEDAWGAMQKVHKKMSNAEIDKLISRQMEQLKLAPSQTLDFDRFQNAYTQELGPAFAATLLSKTDLVPNFIDLVQRKYLPLF